ncbi:MAG: DUF5715 family protein [Bacteroidales bacterium]|nr:DUF5715 family protein [Bacteroidales bacterium]
MRTLLWSVLIVIAVLGVSSAVYTCGYHQEEMEYVLTDDVIVAAAHREAADPSTLEGKVHTLPTHIKPGRLSELFNDTNALQLEAARANGIEPISDLRSAYRLKRPIVHITTSDVYYIDSMTYALPYLVPKAATLLHDIGKAFQDTIKARGGKDYRIRVNSLLRTEYTVRKLRRRNRAATEQSCHLFATTFDVSWAKFDCMDESFPVSLESLKNILAEIIYDFREQGRCYAIYERKQGCFHITVR